MCCSSRLRKKAGVSSGRDEEGEKGREDRETQAGREKGGEGGGKEEGEKTNVNEMLVLTLQVELGVEAVMKEDEDQYRVTMKRKRREEEG
jgi:hypothetical protein